MRKENEIEKMLDRASDQARSGVHVPEPTSRYPELTYEEGIRDALEWVLKKNDDELLGE
jgi:hypothetical protein